MTTYENPTGAPGEVPVYRYGKRNVRNPTGRILVGYRVPKDYQSSRNYVEYYAGINQDTQTAEATGVSRDVARQQRETAEAAAEAGTKYVTRDSQGRYIPIRELTDVQAEQEKAYYEERRAQARTSYSQSAGVGNSGVEQVPGLNTRTAPANEPQSFGGSVRPANEAKPLEQEKTLFPETRQSASDVLANPFANPGRVPLAVGEQVLFAGYDAAEGAILGIGRGATKFGSYLAGGHPVAHELYENPTRAPKVIGSGVVSGLNAADSLFMEAGYGVGEALVSNPLKFGAEIAGQTLLFEGAGKVFRYGRGEPVVKSALRTSSQELVTGERATTVESIVTTGELTSRTVSGETLTFDLKANTVSSNLRITDYEHGTPGITHQTQRTVIEVIGDKASSKGNVYAEVQVKNIAKRSAGEGDYYASLSEGKKAVDVSGSIQTASKTFKQTLFNDRPTGSFNNVFSDVGLKQVEFPFKQTTKGTKSLAQVDTTFTKAFKGTAKTIDALPSELEAQKITADNFGTGKSKGRTTFAQKTYKVGEIGKEETLSEQIRFNTQIRGDNFVINEPASIETDLASGDVTRRFSSSVGEGTTKKLGDVKGFKSVQRIEGNAILDLNEAYGIKEAPKSSPKTQDLYKGVRVDEGVKKAFEYNQKSGSLIYEIEPPTLKVKATTQKAVSGVASAAAVAGDAGSQVVKDIVKTKEASFVRKVTGGTAAGSVFVGKGSNAVVSFDNKPVPPINKSPRIGDTDVDFNLKNDIKAGADSRVKFKDLTGETRKPIYKPGQDNKIEARTDTASSLSFKPIEIEVQKPAQELQPSQLFKPAQDLVTKTQRVTRNKTPNYITPELPVTKLPPLPPLDIPGRKYGGKFSVQVGGKGNKYFFDLGVGGEELITKAKGLAKGTAAASIRVVPLGRKNVDVSSLLGSDFVRNKKGVYVQKTATRISSQGEKQQIPGASKGKRLSKGSSYGKAIALSKQGESLRSIRKRLF